MKSKIKLFTDKQLQQIVDYRNELIDWSIWKRRMDSKRISFYITYGDSRAISKLVGLDVVKNEYHARMRDELSKYIKAKGLYKDNYDTDKITQPHYCDKCGQRIS